MPEIPCGQPLLAGYRHEPTPVSTWGHTYIRVALHVYTYRITPIYVLADVFLGWQYLLFPVNTKPLEEVCVLNIALKAALRQCDNFFTYLRVVIK